MPGNEFDDDDGFFRTVTARAAETNSTALPSPEAIEKARQLAELPLSPEEYRRRASIPIGDAEREEILSLIRWFRRRYPTALDRLAYARRAYARWTGATRR